MRVNKRPAIDPANQRVPGLRPWRPGSTLSPGFLANISPCIDCVMFMGIVDAYTTCSRTNRTQPSQTDYVVRKHLHHSPLELINFASHYGRTLSDASVIFCRFLPMFFIQVFFMAALVGQTAERIFTKLSHVVDIRCYLRTY